MNQACKSRVVSSKRGGSQGGGSQLTEEGRQLLKLYREAEESGIRPDGSASGLLHCRISEKRSGDDFVKLATQDEEAEIIFRNTGLFSEMEEGDEILIALKRE